MPSKKKKKNGAPIDPVALRYLLQSLPAPLADSVRPGFAYADVWRRPDGNYQRSASAGFLFISSIIIMCGRGFAGKGQKMEKGEG